MEKGKRLGKLNQACRSRFRSWLFFLIIVFFGGFVLNLFRFKMPPEILPMFVRATVVKTFETQAFRQAIGTQRHPGFRDPD